MTGRELHASNEQNLTALSETDIIFTTIIWMKFGLDKRTRQKIGNIKATYGLNLDIKTTNNFIQHQISYKLLG